MIKASADALAFYQLENQSACEEESFESFFFAFEKRT